MVLDMERSLKIGIVCYPTYGGSGIVATELGKNLAKLGHEVHFIAYAIPYRLNQYYDNVFYHEVKILDYPLFEYPPYSLALASKMAEIAHYQKLDLIHVHYAIPHAASAFLAREMTKTYHPLKIITTLHGTDITLVGRDPSFMEVTRFSIEQSDAVTAVSRYLRDKTIEFFSVERPIDVIYNFIEEHEDQQKRCNELRQRLAPDGELIISHLSNFRPVKRVEDIIEIAFKVKKQLPVKVMMIGDGPDRSKAEMLARDLGIADDICFLGKQEDIYLLLASSDLFLMPSRLESFGLAALEAMSCGVPCITSNTGGLPELVKDGISGFTAEVGDVESMAGYALKILKDDDLRKKMSRSSREYAFQNFHVDKIIPQYLELYRKILS
ncbi:MAG: N-acetyl-alpha-D-glucosaminyl L-malate synthase BshA [Calditrichaeota bacterium]|nr:N-acetyl-alpha-D-glucosaminyl L-malate synthase BshA [Calditrichota bacterium]RQV98188.1 MAG: N-acetyl-alpha-D-glucosaminyl L-malate synthase BshA [Calditrichota bacterium]